MWIERTSEEVGDWQKSAEQEARSHGRLMAGIVWALVSVLVAGGWTVSFTAGFAAHRSVSGGFWLRLPMIAALAFPFIWYAYRHEKKKELKKLTQRTICPKCDTAGESNANEPCPCSGKFVLASTMRWVED